MFNIQKSPRSVLDIEIGRYYFCIFVHNNILIICISQYDDLEEVPMDFKLQVSTIIYVFFRSCDTLGRLTNTNFYDYVNKLIAFRQLLRAQDSTIGVLTCVCEDMYFILFASVSSSKVCTAKSFVGVFHQLGPFILIYSSI